MPAVERFQGERPVAFAPGVGRLPCVPSGFSVALGGVILNSQIVACLVGGTGLLNL
ncbi:MAG: hypothetical protein ABIO92_04520 [Chloroflexia bacterium]